MSNRIASCAKRPVALLMSGFLAASMAFTGASALAPSDAAADSIIETENSFIIEDVSDEVFAPSRDIAVTGELLAPSTTANRVAYLDAQMEASSWLGEMITLVEPGELEADVAMANDFTSGVTWTDTPSPMFINRLDTASVATYAKTAYNNFKALGNFDGENDTLIEDSAYTFYDKTSHTTSQLKSLAVGDLYYEPGITAVPIAKINVPTGTISSSSPELKNITNWIQTSWCAFLRDCPEYTFWYSRTMPGFSLLPIGQKSGKDYYAIVLMSAWTNQSGQQIARNSTWDSESKIKNTYQAMMSQVDTLVAQAPKTSDYDKVRFFNKWLCDNNEYYKEYNLANDYIPWTAAGGLLSKDQLGTLVGKRQGPVCEGYAKAMQLLCQRASVPVTVQTGRTYEAHMWNLVKLADQWYVVDVTYNDSGLTPTEVWLAVGTDKMTGDRTIDDAITYSNAAGEVVFRADFARAPEIAATGYTSKPVDKAEIYIPDEPVQIFYGQTLDEAIPDPSAYLKSNVSMGSWQFDYSTEPLTELGESNVKVTGVPSATGSQNGYDPVTTEFPITVIPAPIDVEVQMPELESGAADYTGQAVEPAVTVVKKGYTRGAEVIDPSMYEVSYSDNTAAGTARVLVESHEDAGYVFSKSATFRISDGTTPDPGTEPPAQSGMKVDVQGEPVYGDVVKLVASNVPEGANVTYSIVKGTIEIIGNNVKLKQIGEVSVKATATLEDGTTQEKIVTFNIAKCPLTVTAEADDKVYDGTTTVTHYKVKASNVAEGDGAGLTVKLEDGAFDSPDAGDRTATFTVKITGDKSNCYSYPATVTASAKITPAPLPTSVSAPEQKIASDSTGAELPKMIQLSAPSGKTIDMHAEWFTDKECTRPVSSDYKVEGNIGEKVTLYAKLTASGNYAGTASLPVTFAVSDPADVPTTPGNSQTPGQDGNNQGNNNNNNNNQGGTNNGANQGGNNSGSNNNGNNGNTQNNGNQNGNKGDTNNEPLSATDNPPVTPVSTDYANNGTASDYSNNGGAGSASNGPSGTITQTGDILPLVLFGMAFSAIGVGLAMFISRRR